MVLLGVLVCLVSLVVGVQFSVEALIYLSQALMLSLNPLLNNHECEQFTLATLAQINAP
jgi:hypothetical protein